MVVVAEADTLMLPVRAPRLASRLVIVYDFVHDMLEPAASVANGQVPPAMLMPLMSVAPVLVNGKVKVMI